MTLSETERGAAAGRWSCPLRIAEGMAGCHCVGEMDIDVGGEIEVDAR
jgi:hypothetical protein